MTLRSAPRHYNHSSNFDRNQWEHSREYQTLLTKVKTFKRGMSVIVISTPGVVDRIEEKSLTVYVTINRLTKGYSVKVVEHATERTE